MKFDRKKYRESVVRRVQDNQEYSASLDGSYFKIEGLEIWFPKATDEGCDHLFDIVPFVAGKNWPTTDKTVRPGDMTYMLHTYVHRRIGPSEIDILCPKMNYNEPCPICEHIKSLRRKGFEYEDYSVIAPKHRNMFNVQPYDTESCNEEEAKGVRIFEISDYYIGKYLKGLSKDKRTGEIIPFASCEEDGKSISFVMKKTSRGYDIEAVKFEDRVDGNGNKYALPDSYLEQAVSLDELLIIKSYDEIEQIFKAHLTMDGEAGEEFEDAVDIENNVGQTVIRGTGTKLKPSKVSRRTIEEDEDADEDRDGGSDNNSIESEDDNPCIGDGTLGEDFNQLATCEDCEEDIFQECKKLNRSIREKSSTSARRRRG